MEEALGPQEARPVWQIAKTLWGEHKDEDDEDVQEPEDKVGAEGEWDQTVSSSQAGSAQVENSQEEPATEPVPLVHAEK